MAWNDGKGGNVHEVHKKSDNACLKDNFFSAPDELPTVEKYI